MGDQAWSPGRDRVTLGGVYGLYSNEDESSGPRRRDLPNSPSVFAGLTKAPRHDEAMLRRKTPKIWESWRFECCSALNAAYVKAGLLDAWLRARVRSTRRRPCDRRSEP